jgi:hypothetical protein
MFENRCGSGHTSFVSVVEGSDQRRLGHASGMLAWERFGKELRLLNSSLNRTESTGSELQNVLITRRSLVQNQPPQPNPLIRKGLLERLNWPISYEGSRTRWSSGPFQFT